MEGPQTQNFLLEPEVQDSDLWDRDMSHDECSAGRVTNTRLFQGVQGQLGVSISSASTPLTQLLPLHAHLLRGSGQTIGPCRGPGQASHQCLPLLPQGPCTGL